MRSLTAAVICIASCAQAETFAERWPQPVAIEPAAVAERLPVERPSKATRRARAQQRGFVCHRQTYYVGRHRYWKCRR
jgi:hypothetical protein